MKTKNYGVLCLASMLVFSGCATPQKTNGADTSFDTSHTAVGEGIGEEPGYVFDQNQYVVCDSASLQQNSLSFSFWVKPDSNYPNQVIFSFQDESGNGIELINEGINQDETYHGLTIHSQNGSNESWISQEDVTLKTNHFNQIVMTSQNKETQIYLNGELVAEGSLIKSFSSLTGNPQFGGEDASIQATVAMIQTDSKVMTASQVQEHFESQYPQVLLDEIQYDDTEDTQNNFWLAPTLDEDKYTVQWESDHPEAIEVSKNHGVIHPITQDTLVTLTAKVDDCAVKEFTFFVRAENDATDVYRDTQEVLVQYNHFINADTPLLTQGSNESSITWSTTDTSSISIENDQIQKLTDEEKPVASFQITITKGEESTTIEKDLVVLDAYAGYVLSYFNGNEEAEVGNLAYSTDGLHWTDLSGTSLFDTNGLGTGRVRDPFIGRDASGDFVILSTEGYDNPSIYYWKSKDLITAEEVKELPLAAYDPSTHATGERAWAPEFTYDAETNQYYIYYSDPGNETEPGYIYYVTTSDFETFSYPKIFYGPGYTVIDATVFPLNGKYWMFYKDERKAGSTIFYASSSSLAQEFGVAYDENFIFPKKYIEGPFVIAGGVGKPNYLYVDNYPYSTFYVASFTTLGSENDITWLEPEDYQLPNEDVRHGSAIPVTQLELDRLLSQANN